jgi:hypothetical protein
MNWPATPSGPNRKDKNVNDDRLNEATTNEVDDERLAVTRDASATATAAKPAPSKARQAEPIVPLFSPDECQSLRSQWESLQAGFVDEPRQAVEHADRLVHEAIDELAKGFSSQRQGLERQWHDGEREASTEDLRLAFRRYRSFFERLLTM